MPDNSPALFDLEGLADLARKVSPELAKEVEADASSAPDSVPQPGAVAPEPVRDLPTDSVPDLEPEPEPETVPEPEAEPDTEKTSEDLSIGDELEELNRQSVAAAAAKNTPAPVEAPPEVVTKSVPTVRDEDLKLDSRQSAAMHPKTKKIIEERNQKIIIERNKAEALAKEKELLSKELNQAREALKKGAIPEGTEKELAELREVVRESDILRDPSLRIKYDSKIEANQDGILKVLEEFGVAKVDGSDKNDPKVLAQLKQQGLNFKTVTPFIKKLSDAGYEEEAETLRELLRDNIRIKNAKDSEVMNWRTNFAAKKEQSGIEQRQFQERQMSDQREHSSRILNSDISELSKDFPYLMRPSEPLPTDSPSVTRVKQDAIAAHEAAAKQVSDAVALLDASKVSPDRLAEVNGRLTANAVQSIIFKQHLLPRLNRELADLRARNAELEAKVGKIKTAGTLSRAHAAAATAPAGARAALPESNEDAAKQIAREMGLSID